MCVAIYYSEADKYVRDALEKVLINQFRPKFNATSNDAGKGKLSHEDIQDIKWYLSKGLHSHAKLATAYNVSPHTIQSIASDRLHSSVQIPDGFQPFKTVEEDRKIIEKAVWQRVYLKVIQGYTLSQVSNDVGLGISAIKQFLYDTPVYYKEFYRELEREYGVL